MEEIFKDITDQFQNGAMLIMKMLLIYIIIPEIIGLIVFAMILKIRGRMLSLIMMGVSLICLMMFVKYGLPSITDSL